MIVKQFVADRVDGLVHLLDEAVAGRERRDHEQRDQD